MLSLIIPTYNEKENIEKLIPEVFGVLDENHIECEIIIVDDNSPDATADAVGTLSSKYNVRVVRRPGKLGLSSAVLEGFMASRGDVLGVMDADFSHPFEKIPGMLDHMKDHDMVIGSRNVGGGSTEDWPVYRKVISKFAAALARPLTSIKDPMSGFFLLNRSILDEADLSPKGFKIGLEIAVKCNPIIKEVPITFRNRLHGESKMNRGEVWNYLKHLKGLYFYRSRCRLGLIKACAPRKRF